MLQIKKTVFVPEYYRSSRPEVFFKKGVLRNFTKFTGKHLCQSLFFSQVLSCEFCEICKNTFFYRTPPVTTSDINRGVFRTFSNIYD